MDFLKSAVASAIAQGPPFPYSFGDKVDLEQSIWTLYNGTKREDGSNCSIFAFDVPANKGRLPLAKNALKKLRTLRHPGVIKVLDTVETDSYIYIATERVVPLVWHVRRKSLSPETIKWGLYGVARTVKFVNTDASSIHGNLKVGSVYTSESGEWKLGGFEVLSSIKDDEPVIYTYGSLVPDSARYCPPEIVQGGWDVIKKNPHFAVDSFNFGALIFQVCHGSYNGPDQAGQTKDIPPSMQSSYKRLCNANPKARISVADFLQQGTRKGSFFDGPLIKLTEGIDNLGVKSPDERDQFLSDLADLNNDFPEDFFKLKILPELIKSVEFGGGGPKALALVLKIASQFSEDDFGQKVSPFLIRAFANPDRAIRVCLLDNLSLVFDQIPQKVVNDKIFPQIATGFTDLQPVVREQTLKSVLILVTKLSDRIINGELLRQLAKTANDEQPGIRTNTTICLGKLARNLGTSSRSKVLIAAFTRSLRDPFVHARNAALMALAATIDYFTEDDCACKILPVLCPLLIDKEKLVRDQANRTMEIYVQKVTKAAAVMPDSALPQASDAQPARMSTPQQSGASSWAGWAISSFTNKVSAASGDMQTAAGSANAAGTKESPSPEVKKLAAVSTSSLRREVLAEDSGTSSPTADADAVAEAFLPDDGADTWADMGDMGDDDGVVDAPSTTAATSPMAPPFDDGEPDFAGWLAAQAQKKRLGVGKPLPKGLTKSAAAKKTTKPTAKPVAKKIDMKPKETGADDDDGWGDGW
ncbi:protein kinase-like protein [Ophiocordyceps camponoti-floridani]|uniref:Protein kinase-like protein n=1 Tax=Ophiocordyceps camponoti-floridani TaxID=2030778 RepID=A0A8H4Q3C1_9HYPO|nr:protein kinase-like protein [Ophiocordyceps camponoti-floridani]